MAPSLIGHRSMRPNDPGRRPALGRLRIVQPVEVEGRGADRRDGTPAAVSHRTSAPVFDEFYRGGAKGSGPVETDGLGLGLSIVRRMAQALDHPLALASRPGHGTRVSLTVPLSRAADAAPEIEAEAAAIGAGLVHKPVKPA